MTAQQPTPSVNQTQENKPNDKELNFRALEQKYQKQLDQERQGRLDAERKVQEALQKQSSTDDDDDSEPYVDHKRLNKTLSSFEKRMEEKIEQKAEEKARGLMEQQKQSQWLKNNPDFYDVMQHAERFAQTDPELAESILEMPEGFERQKLVYKNIKALGIHKPKAEEPSIQAKIDANRKSPYYQPTGVGSMPYNAGQGDFSKSGQKNAYAKLQELKQKLRI